MTTVWATGSEAKALTAEVTITSWHPSPTGGGIALARDQSGDLRRVLMAPDVAPRAPEEQEVWRVSGTTQLNATYGWQLHASVALPLLPTGRAIIRYLATSTRFPGVGWKTAGRLWSVLGDGLYDALRAGDATTISRVIGPELAVVVVTGFGLLADEVEVFRWLDRYGVHPRTAAAAAGLWGAGAIQRIQTDPYTLVLLEAWATVDARALRLGVQPGDPRRTRAAVEEALARSWRLGRTAVAEDDLLRTFDTLLNPPAPVGAAYSIADALKAGRVLCRPDGLLQSRAAWFMEREVTSQLSARLTRLRTPLPRGILNHAFEEFEAAAGHKLTENQRHAVATVAGKSVAAVVGGAGTGKTTIVRAVLAAYDALAGHSPGEMPFPFETRQVAVAGRAAKRIAEATGRDAWTVARLLRRIEAGADSIRRGVLVMDEASMLDLPTLYRLLVSLPKEINLLFVGDPGQLPPIGPGSPFHDLVVDKGVPKVALDVVHRQAEATGIPIVAAAIRHGHMPALPRFEPSEPYRPGVFILPAPGRETGDAALAVFRAMAGPPPAEGSADELHARDIQVLCPLLNGSHGTKALNQAIEQEWMLHQVAIPGWGLSVGSKVLWLKNDYSKAPIFVEGRPMLDAKTGKPVCAGFINGALGTIRHPMPDGAWVEFDDGSADTIRPRDLERLTHGWAISVHKAQGSAFRRVIVPIGRSRLLDRALIYTAVTRATETVVLVGDPALLRECVKAPPRAVLRPRTITLPCPASCSTLAAANIL